MKKSNVNLSNLENVLQRNLRTDRVRDWIFRASGGRNFDFFPAFGSWVRCIYQSAQKSFGYITE